MVLNYYRICCLLLHHTVTLLEIARNQTVELFEHDLLPIPRLIFSDPVQTLIPLKQKLLDLSTNYRVHSAAISDSLQISVEHARFVLDTLTSLLHSDVEPLVAAKLDEIDTGRSEKSKTITLCDQGSNRIFSRASSTSILKSWFSILSGFVRG